MKRNIQPIRRMQRGFSLVELVVVVAILGVLGAVVAKNMIGTTDGAKAELLTKSATSIADNWSMINQACGTSTAIAGSPIPAAGKTVSDVIFGGSANVAATYATCYARAKVLALTEISQPSGAAGVYNIDAFGVTLAGGGTSPLQVGYVAVPDNITLLMAQKYNSTLATLAASDAASPVVQYSVAAASTRTVTILKQI